MSETQENRAPPSEVTTDNGLPSDSKGVTDSTQESLATAGDDPGTTEFLPGHARSSSEPPSVGHFHTTGQHSRLSGYSTGHSASSSVEGQTRFVQCILSYAHESHKIRVSQLFRGVRVTSGAQRQTYRPLAPFFQSSN